MKKRRGLGLNSLNCKIMKVKQCLTNLNIFWGTQRAASPYVMIFREHNWVFPWRYNYSFLSHLSNLNCFFFPHFPHYPFWLMGLEGSEHLRWELSLGSSYTGTDCGKQRAGRFPSPSDMFLIFSTSSAKLPFSSCRKRYIIWRSWAKYLIWMIMLQVSHQNCSA